VAFLEGSAFALPENFSASMDFSHLWIASGCSETGTKEGRNFRLSQTAKTTPVKAMENRTLWET
jgi:hypothetical protein